MNSLPNRGDIWSFFLFFFPTLLSKTYNFRKCSLITKTWTEWNTLERFNLLDGICGKKYKFITNIAINSNEKYVLLEDLQMTCGRFTALSTVQKNNLKMGPQAKETCLHA